MSLKRHIFTSNTNKWAQTHERAHSFVLSDTRAMVAYRALDLTPLITCLCIKAFWTLKNALVPPPPPLERGRGREDLKMALQRSQLTTNQETDSCWRLLCWNHMVAITEYNINQGTDAECNAYCLRLSLGPSGWYFRSTTEAITGIQLKITQKHTSLWNWLRLGRILSSKN